MSFREKSTWITFAVLLVAFGFYLTALAAHLIWPAHPHTNFFVLSLALLLGIVVMEVALHVVIAIRSPADAKAPPDEREQLIALRAKRPAFFVLLACAFLSIGMIRAGAGADASAQLATYAVLLAICLGELTNYGAQLYYYRRGT